MTAQSIEKGETNAQQIEDTSQENVHVVKKVHADGHVDLVDARAIGGAWDEMPAGYFWSIQFIGTVIVRRLWVASIRRNKGSYVPHAHANIPSGSLLWKHMRLSWMGSTRKYTVRTALRMLFKQSLLFLLPACGPGPIRFLSSNIITARSSTKTLGLRKT